MSLRNRNKVILAACCIASTLLIGGISAYFADADSATNSFTVGGNRIELMENFIPPSELVPGVTFTKDVKVTNTGPNDCYIRIMAVFTNSDMGQYCDVDWNTTDWVYDSASGYWYYTEPVANGERTPSLFTTVKLSDATPEAVIKDFNVVVYAESYQAEGFNDYQDAWDNYKTNKPHVSLPVEDLYSVSVLGTDVSSSHTVSGADMTILLTVVTDGSSVLRDLQVTDDNGDAVPLTKQSDSVYSFTMPTSDVTVSYALDTLYTITVLSDDITSSHVSAIAGTTVTITGPGTIQVQDEGGTDVLVTPVDTEQVTFTMPDSNVTVTCVTT